MNIKENEIDKINKTPFMILTLVMILGFITIPSFTIKYEGFKYPLFMFAILYLYKDIKSLSFYDLFEFTHLFNILIFMFFFTIDTIFLSWEIHPNFIYSILDILSYIVIVINVISNLAYRIEEQTRENNPEIIGRLRELRLEKQMTLDELAKELKIACSELRLYEKNCKKADYKTLVSISKYFQVTPDYLVGNFDRR
ncbi:helix-turn-helix domain-containing protein [Senegalia massiliensis]|uniref:XRE family transcriptional regulator n=1 Tax=Senegalia massiliensis TaxID=1720316 RepID=A0A845R0N9_9CLOT|nr:helix-turn-helix transcriptional regulator [Senegalia massiliensis]NBI07569.1 XRE family transcriptional regulator [Senegalia massiliensis]